MSLRRAIETNKCLLHRLLGVIYLFTQPVWSMSDTYSVRPGQTIPHVSIRFGNTKTSHEQILQPRNINPGFAKLIPEKCSCPLSGIIKK